MKIEFHQSGGFAGLTRGCEVSEEEMPADLVKLGHELARSKASKPANPAERDTFQFKLVIDTGKGKVEVNATPGMLPPKFGKLLEYLMAKSKPVPP